MTPEFNQVFIGGVPRSGTTMLGAMLGAAPGCQVTPESQFKIEALRLIPDPPAPSDWPILTGFLGKQRRFRCWGLDEARLRSAAVPSAYPAFLQILVELYAQNNGRPRPACWIDHTPENLKYAATLAGLFPRARFIHLLRDPRAVAASMLAVDWSQKQAHGAARSWLRQVACGLAAETALPGRVLRVRFEDLVTAPEPELRRICDFCGLDYDPAMAAGGKFKVPAGSGRQHALVGRPPRAERISAWRQELSSREIEIIEWVCGDLLTLLGYRPDYGVPARPPGGGEKIRFLLKTLFGIMRDFPRRRFRLFQTGGKTK